MSLDLDQIKHELSQPVVGGYTNKNSIQLKRERYDIVEQLTNITNKAEAENRNLYREERDNYSRLESQFLDLTATIKRTEAAERRNAEAAVPLNGGQDFAHRARRGDELIRLTPTESLEQHLRAQGMSGDGLSFDRLIRGMARGNWRNAEREKRAVSGLTDASGGVLLDDEVSSQIIDLARAALVVTQAGAQTIPMQSSKLTVPRLLTDMKPEWLDQLESATDSSPTFDGLELEAKTVRVYSEISEELLEDAEVAENFISAIAAAAIGAEIDRVALAGSGVGQEPRGLLNQEGTTPQERTGVATWADLVRGKATIEGRSFRPTAAILTPQSESDLNLAVAVEGGQYIQPPATLESLPRIVSAGVPTGIGSDDTKALLAVADWTKLVIGMRSQIRVQTSPLPKEYGVALVVAARIDVGIERAGAFDLRLVDLGE